MHVNRPPSLMESAELLESDTDALDDVEPHERRFLDPVHDYVTLEPRVAAFVDTKQFQRLRNLKQLGAAYFVFPGGAHNRFEHCLGVAHLARLMVDSLRRRQPSLKITNRDVFCVQVAGLMHDLGHGPFSHVFDNQFLPRVCPETTWSHEQGSEMMFDAVIEENPQFNIPEDWVRFIKDLIRGKPRLSIGHQPPEKPFLFQIVANMENGLDVDKLDYIARDSLNCGVQHGAATSRFINDCRVIGNDIVYPHKDIMNVFQVYNTRYMLHKQVYNHKTGKAIEYMIVDALIAADSVLKISAKITNPKEYLYLTDSVFEEIERSSDPRLATSRQIIERIRTRNLYRIVDFKLVPSVCKEAWKSTLTVEHLVEEAATRRTLLSEDGDVSDYPVVEADDVIVDWSSLHMGMKDRNPMDLVKFYGKHKPNESFVARPDESSNLMPGSWQEVQISVFARDPTKMHAIQEAYRSLLSKLPDVEVYPTQTISAPEVLMGRALTATPSPQYLNVPLSSAAGTVSQHSSFTSTTTVTADTPSTPPRRPIPLSAGNSASPSIGSFASDYGTSPSGGLGVSRSGHQFTRGVKEQNQFTTLTPGRNFPSSRSVRNTPKAKGRVSSAPETLGGAKRKRDADAIEEEDATAAAPDGLTPRPASKPRLD